jgi:hypothetical protein
MRKKSTLIRMIFGLTISMFPGVSIADAPADSAKDYSSEVSSLTVRISHRAHPDFQQTVKTEMNKREQIGDTDFFFEVVEFFPHFAITDSTKKTISLSDEPENVAFKIRVYEIDELVDETWAFYHINIPHFSRTSLLKFDTVAFEYRGELFEKEEKADRAHEDAKGRSGSH